MARRAGICELHRCHQFAACDGTKCLQGSGMKRQKLVRIFVANGRSAVLRICESQVCICSRSAMAIPAFELNVGTIRSAANRLHVNRMIQFNLAGVTGSYARNRTQRGKFRMSLREARSEEHTSELQSPVHLVC